MGDPSRSVILDLQAASEWRVDSTVEPEFLEPVKSLDDNMQVQCQSPCTTALKHHRGTADILMGNLSSQPEQSAQPSAVKEQTIPLELCGTKPIDVVPGEHYVQQLWEALDKALEQSGCVVGSDVPEGEGGSLDPKRLKICGAAAPKEEHVKETIFSNSVSPPPPSVLPEMEDALAVTSSIRALSPRIVAVHVQQEQGSPLCFHLLLPIGPTPQQELSQASLSVHSRDESLLGNYATTCGRIER